MMPGSPPYRIIIVTDNYLPHFSGHANAVASWAERLASRGHKVLVVADSLNHRYAYESGTFDVLRSPRWSFLPYGNALASMRPKGRRLAVQLEQFRPDLIHFHGYWALCQQVANIFTNARLPFVATVHGLPQQFIADNILNVHHYLWHKLTRFYNRSQAISVPSAHVQNQLMGKGIDGHKLHLIPTGIDEHMFQPHSQQAREHLRQHYGWKRPVIAFVGRLSGEKNLTDFMMLDHKAYHLVAIGTGPIKLPRYVQQLPKQAREALPGFLKAIDVLFLPSLSETQGLIVGEALAAGTAVVVPENSASAEWVIENINGVTYQAGQTQRAMRAIQQALTLNRDSIPDTIKPWSWSELLVKMEAMYAQSLQAACASLKTS